MSLGKFLTSSDVDLARSYNYKSEADQTLGAFFGLALVDAGHVDSAGNKLRMGATYDSKVITPGLIVGVIKNLCKTDQAYFFGLGQIEGQEADPSVTQEVDVFGTAAGAASTDTLTGTVVWKLKHAYAARKFLNMLMGGREFDLWMFRNNGVEFAGADEHGVVYSGFSNSSSNRDAKISGGFTSMYKSFSGFLEAHLGVAQASLKNDIKFTMGEITAVTAVAADCSTIGRKKFTFNNGTSSGSLAFILAPLNACVDWYCTQADGSDLPPTGKGSFDSATATLTLPSDLEDGKYIYKVFAVNATGIKGEVYVEVVVS